MTDETTREAPTGAVPVAFRDRIVGEGWENPEQLLANPKNWRVHPRVQEDALESVLEAVGWVQRIIVNQRTGFVVDGHLRVALAIRRGEPRVPVLYTDLSEDEEALILATLDPIGAMAGTDRDKLAELLSEVTPTGEAMEALLSGIRERNLTDMVAVEAVAEEPAGAPRVSLVERFGVPPFSILDARQGYWQDRKRAWLALGIKSELGRGADIMPNGTGGGFAKAGAVTPAGQGGMSAGLVKKRTEAKAKKADAIPGGAGAGSVYKKKGFASPGGSPRPAMKLKGGKTQRGDGKGRALKGKSK